ncbi:hypothetical protein GF396_04510 [Candidatus Pacearchaeota archaeon]|nr:hypothetical protein [Candidatus Pacearchaeota archaeon]
MEVVKKIDGKTLKITLASFEEAIDLQEALSLALREEGLEIKGLDLDQDSIGITSETLSSVLNIVLKAGTNKNLREKLFVCSGRALFDGKKIDKDLFEDIEYRQYFFKIMFFIAEANLNPFFKSLFSKLPTVKEAFIKSLKQKFQQD